MWSLKIVAIWVIIFLFSSCLDKPTKQEEKPVSVVAVETPVHRAARTFWDGYDYSDMKMLEDSIGFYKAFAAWGELLLQLPVEEGAAITGKFIADGSNYPEMQVQLMRIAELCFNDPNSFYRNEELYLPMLDAILQAPNVEEESKSRYRFQHRMAMKNRKGTIAEDFRYITSEGERGNLHQWSHDYILLYFFNPECHDCARVKAYIEASPVLGKLQEEGRLKVIAIYPDEDMGAWNRHVGENPNGWVTARYISMDEAEAFYLPAIPNLYLLDKDKKVLLKDAPIEQIEKMLVDENLLLFR